ncbi:hypothetical protein U0070_015508 [Myodes glareolus]|uniref:VWFA domain-containing protein n=1 Tax=Myodes glareolus TaxID=447135 RepID=A0AAW0HFZ0_MYOGA
MDGSVPKEELSTQSSEPVPQGDPMEGKQRQPQRNHVSVIENTAAIRNMQACLRSFSPNHKGVLALRCSPFRLPVVSRDLKIWVLWACSERKPQDAWKGALQALGENTERRCLDCKVDLSFLIDGSTNLGKRRFQIQKQFLADVVQALDVGPAGPLVGVVQYGGRPRLCVGWALPVAEPHAVPARAGGSGHLLEIMTPVYSPGSSGVPYANAKGIGHPAGVPVGYAAAPAYSPSMYPEQILPSKQATLLVHLTNGAVPPYSSSPNPDQTAVYPVRSAYPQQSPDAQLSLFSPQQGTYYTQPLYAAPPYVIHHTTVVQPNGMPATVCPAPIPPPRGSGVTMGMVAGTTMAMSAGTLLTAHSPTPVAPHPVTVPRNTHLQLCAPSVGVEESMVNWLPGDLNSDLSLAGGPYAGT